MRRSSRFLAAAFLLGCLGCGGSVERGESVPVSKLPGPVMTGARSAMPGHTLTSAYKIKFQGKDAYEVRGKAGDGKVQDVYISLDGKALREE